MPSVDKKRLMPKLIGLLFGIALIFSPILLFFAFIMLIGSTFDGLCGEEEVSLKASPTGKYMARAYRRDCGATTSASPQVEVWNQQGLWKNEKVVYVGESGTDIDIDWRSNTILVIKSGAKMIGDEQAHGQIKILLNE